MPTPNIVTKTVAEPYTEKTTDGVNAFQSYGEVMYVDTTDPTTPTNPLTNAEGVVYGSQVINDALWVNNIQLWVDCDRAVDVYIKQFDGHGNHSDDVVLKSVAAASSAPGVHQVFTVALQPGYSFQLGLKNNDAVNPVNRARVALSLLR